MDKEKKAARREHMRRIGKMGGMAAAKSGKAHRPFRDVNGLAAKAGSKKGYTFKRRTTK